MKTIALIFAAVTLAVVACTVALSSCIAPKYKPSVLFPAAALTWPAVEEDFDRGIADGISDGVLTQQAAVAFKAEADKLENGLNTKNLPEVQLVAWGNLKPWADRGIDDKLADGEVGPGVAASLREQLTNFTETIAQLQAVYQ
jgi:hypothetical protein